MADTYGVTPAEIAEQLPRLFANGFGVGTKPSATAVASFISDADTKVTLTLTVATGVTPTPGDAVARLARRYIIDAVVGRVLRLVYTGNDPADVNAAASPYEEAASDILVDLAALRPATRPRAVGWAGSPSTVTTNLVTW